MWALKDPQGNARRGYDGVVVCAPVTIPYVRYSTDTAHWWIGRALHELTRTAGIKPLDLDGVILSEGDELEILFFMGGGAA